MKKEIITILLNEYQLLGKSLFEKVNVDIPSLDKKQVLVGRNMHILGKINRILKGVKHEKYKKESISQKMINLLTDIINIQTFGLAEKKAKSRELKQFFRDTVFE